MLHTGSVGCQVAQLNDDDIAAKYGGEKLEEGLRRWEKIRKGVLFIGKARKTWDNMKKTMEHPLSSMVD